MSREAVSNVSYPVAPGTTVLLTIDCQFGFGAGNWEQAPPADAPVGDLRRAAPPRRGGRASGARAVWGGRRRGRTGSARSHAGAPAVRPDRRSGAGPPHATSARAA